MDRAVLVMREVQGLPYDELDVQLRAIMQRIHTQCCEHGRDDEDGFIQDPAVWNETVALGLAKTEGVEELTERSYLNVKTKRSYLLHYQTRRNQLNKI